VALVASLRNAPAVGQLVAALLCLGVVDRVTIVAAGEHGRPMAGTRAGAVRDRGLAGAGAVALECRGAADGDQAEGAGLSSEAELAARAFAAGRDDLPALLAESASGRELTLNGFEADVGLAAGVGVDDGVPWLRPDGFVARLPFRLRRRRMPTARFCSR